MPDCIMMMRIWIALLIFGPCLAQGFFETDIASDHQCSSGVSSSTCNISDWSTCPASVKCLNVMWAEFKPYSYKKDSTFMGIIPGIFKNLIEYCCGECWKVNLTAEVSRQSITAGKIPSYIDIALPFSTVDAEAVEHGMTFVSLVANPSVVYITKKSSASAIPRKLIAAVWNAWPVLVMALLLSLVSGVFLWFLEFWRNVDEFPRSFFHGSWEGFWWAFVSMTTVGYGDKAPRSILGRLFSIFWIMIGICICSIFTATLTTALTTITLEEKKTLARAKVGAIRSSLEAYTGVNQKAKVINYNSTRDLWRALENENVEGILLDSYFSATSEISNYIKENDYRISQTVEVNDRSYGILVRNRTLRNCLNNEFQMVLYDTYELTEIITGEIESESKENEAAARSDSIFNPTGDIFWPSFYVCISFAIVMFICGVVWEFFFKDKFFKRGKTGSSAELDTKAKSLDQMEKEMIADIQKMFSALRTQRDMEVGIAGPMKVEDVEQNGVQMGSKSHDQQFAMSQSQQRL